MSDTFKATCRSQAPDSIEIEDFDDRGELWIRIIEYGVGQDAAIILSFDDEARLLAFLRARAR